MNVCFITLCRMDVFLWGFYLAYRDLTFQRWDINKLSGPFHPPHKHKLDLVEYYFKWETLVSKLDHSVCSAKHHLSLPKSSNKRTPFYWTQLLFFHMFSCTIVCFCQFISLTREKRERVPPEGGKQRWPSLLTRKFFSRRKELAPGWPN